MHIFDELKERGLVFQTTDEAALRKALEEGQVSYYTGYDPTADSLHLGHLVAILTSRRLQLAGHKPYALVGGATGLIGDPSFKDAERSLQTKETVEGWVKSIQNQLSRFLDFEKGDNKAEMVNNYDWFSSISFIDFLRDVGKYFTVNYMMSKDSVKSRIETGISYTEFAYQIMQGYDFYILNQNHGVTLQIGGSDKTSPYEMYQFWMNVMDADAIRFLKIFTFLSLDEIEEIRQQFEAAPHERLAQKVLAREVVSLVHGQEAYQEALNITEQLFAGNIKNLSVKELKQGLRGVPNYQVQVEDNLNIVELLVTAGVVNSKRQAREDVQNGAIYLNGERIQDLDYVLSDSDKLEDELTVIRRGKKKYFVLTY